MSLLLYREKQSDFFEDVRYNRFQKKMVDNAKYFKLSISSNERHSYLSNGDKIKSLLEASNVNDTYVTFEYMLPYVRNRIDCMIYGCDKNNQGYVVHIELKQWDNVSPTDFEGNFVETYTGGGKRVVEHPSQQVEGYTNYLNGFIDILSTSELSLYGCAYCYNYTRVDNTGLYDPVYNNLLKRYKTFSSGDLASLAEELHGYLCNGSGFDIFTKFYSSPHHPSKKLLDSASNIVDNRSDFSLLREQQVARNTIMGLVTKYSDKKSVVIVSGGPGTGKTVIALHMVAELARLNKNVYFATKSKPLIEGIKDKMARGSSAKLLFSSLDKFRPSKSDENSIDVLLIDEAHRISLSANSQYTRPEDRTGLPQIDTLIRAAKTIVFFIDDKQPIRSLEVCNTQMIKDCAAKYKARIEEIELKSQFRCNGSNNYLDWVENVLGYDTEETSFANSEYDFKIFDNPASLYEALLKKNALKNTTARLTAGFCWPWSKTLDENGELVKDVRIGDFAMPWETHGDITRTPPGYVKWYEWAYKPEGIKQVGCIYTAQGFEFDYIGVIIGNDLKYDNDNDKLFGDISATKDPTLRKNRQSFDEYVKNIYRVLLTRGMKGCYVYFCDKEVESYFKKKLSVKSTSKFEPFAIPYKSINIEYSVPQEEKFVHFLPYYSVKAACGYFGAAENIEEEGWLQVDNIGRLDKWMFVVKASGHSMEPTIHDGDFCIFRANIVGSRNNKIVLAQSSDLDPDYNGSYTIKKYTSRSLRDEETGEWLHEEIVLQPINPAYKPIILHSEDENSYAIIAELIKVL